MKKLTTEEKIKRGTLVKHREQVNHFTTQPLITRPEPMHPLGEIERRYYDFCADLLIGANVLTMADVPGLTRAATWYKTYCDALEQVTKYGAIQETSTGYTTKTGAYSVLTESERILSTWERSVGLNVAGRAKLPPPPQPVKSNPFDEL